MVLKKACWTFGALETGRKLSLDSRRLHILIQMLIEQDMHDQAFIIGREFLQKQEFELYKEYFHHVHQDISKNRVYAEAHKNLLGEDILETKRKLRELKKQKSLEQEIFLKKLASQNAMARKQQKAEFLLLQNPNEAIFTKKIEPIDEKSSVINLSSKDMVNSTPSHSIATSFSVQNLLNNEYPTITLEEYGYRVKKNFLFVPTKNGLLKVMDHFKSQTHIGVDTEFKGTALSLISFASTSLVAVFDVFLLKSIPEFLDFVKFILMDSKIDILVHSFKTDQYVLNYNFKILDPLKMNHVIELNDLIKDPNTGKKLGMLQMSELVLKRTYSKSYQRTNWLARPLSDEKIYWAGLDGVIPLQIFISHIIENPQCKPTYYKYEEPEILPSVVLLPSTSGKQKKSKKPRPAQDSQTEGPGHTLKSNTLMSRRDSVSTIQSTSTKSISIKSYAVGHSKDQQDSYNKEKTTTRGGPYRGRGNVRGGRGGHAQENKKAPTAAAANRGGMSKSRGGAKS